MATRRWSGAGNTSNQVGIRALHPRGPCNGARGRAARCTRATAQAWLSASSLGSGAIRTRSGGARLGTAPRMALVGHRMHPTKSASSALTVSAVNRTLQQGARRTPTHVLLRSFQTRQASSRQARAHTVDIHDSDSQALRPNQQPPSAGSHSPSQAVSAADSRREQTRRHATLSQHKWHGADHVCLQPPRRAPGREAVSPTEGESR